MFAALPVLADNHRVRAVQPRRLEPVDNLDHAIHLHIRRQVDIQPAVPRRRVQQREFVARNGRKPPQVGFHLLRVSQQHFVQVAHLHALRLQLVGDVRLEAEPRAVIDPYRGAFSVRNAGSCAGGLPTGASSQPTAA
jgi:hypothetical protein